MNAKRNKLIKGYGLTEMFDKFGNRVFRSNKPKELAPKIIREYNEGGVRMYECTGGRHFIADTYDKMFIPVQQQVKN